MLMNQYSIIIVLALFLVSACDIINPEEDAPAFLEFGTIELVTDSGNEGSNYHNINNISVFSQAEFIGTFELDATIPIFNIGTENFSFEAGIKENGISSSRIPYPFYQIEASDQTFDRGETNEVSLSFSYKNNIIFETIEDFENGNELTVSQTSVFPQITTDQNEVLEGNRSLAIRLPDTDDEFNAQSNSYEIPENLPVFIELDYTCNQIFAVGLTSTIGSNDLQLLKVTLTPTSERNKIYIRVDDLIQSNPGDSYKIVIQATKDDSLEEGTIIIDNLKLVRSS